MSRSSVFVLILGDMLLLLMILAVLLAMLLGCAHEEPPPPIPPAPEDLSTWSVPELVQPPVEEPPAPPPVAEKPAPAEQVYRFTPGATFAVSVQVGVPLDLLLERGEQVRNLVGGDRAPAEATQTAPWEVKEGGDGTGESLRHHVFVTAAAPQLTMGLIVTTTKRTYYLTCTSVKTSPIRVVRWQYPRDPTDKPLRAKEPGLLPDPAQPRHYHIGYALTSSQPPPHWHPRQVVDDGKKTYIIYPEGTLFATVPMLRLIGPNGPQLVNARQFLNVVIVDHLVPRAELRVGLGGRAETVTITRGALQTIACPGDQACPVWPQAAQALARRQP